MAPAEARPFAWGRSLLFCPGDRPERFVKAMASGADSVVLDLEDAVDPAQKASARRSVARYLAGRPSGSVAVRCNPAGSDEFELDMDALAEAEIQALVLPKVTDWARTEEIVSSRYAGRAVPAVCVTVESARGACELPGPAERGHIISAVSWGPYDLAADLGLRHVRCPDGSFAEPIAQVRSQLLIVAAARCLAALDTVTVRYGDSDVVERDTREAAELGFVGKFAIHPSQIDPIHRGLRPGADEIARAREVVGLAEQRGAGAVALGGQMFDEALYRNARNTLIAAGQLTDSRPTGE